MRTARQLLLLATLATFAAPPASAHHSLSMFDKSRRVTLQATIKQFEWVSPHTWLHVMTHDVASGRDTEWRVEGPSPGMLLRAGWTQASLPAGDQVIVVMYPARDPNSREGLLARVTNGGKVWINPFEGDAALD